MSSPKEQDPRAKYFTKKWTVTVPSYPGLKFYPATPSHFDVLLPMAIDPINNELMDNASKIWDEAAITEWKERNSKRHVDLNKNFNGLNMLVELDGKAVGYGDVYEFKAGEATVGIVLNKEARGKGIGKVGIQIFTQLGWELGLKISSGTMKANKAMRGVMKSLGVEEVEKVVEIPGRGVVAELDYEIEREKWKNIDMKVEFEPVI